MKKTVIIINGAGGAGKDTLCAIAARHYAVTSVSAVDRIKEIARFQTLLLSPHFMEERAEGA